MTTGLVHATAVARHGPDGWRAVLLRGRSGAGKSDLALRLMAAGWRLVGDDQVHVWTSAGRAFVRGAEPLQGRIEARGLGIVTVTSLDVSPVGLVCDCIQQPVERLQDFDSIEVGGISLPRLALDVRPASAVQTVTLAISRL